MQIQFKNIEKFLVAGFILSIISFPFVVLFTLQETQYNELEKNSFEIASAITSLRQFYTSEVVERIQSANGKTVITEDYKNVHGGIPIPATFSIEIGQVFSKASNDARLGYAFVSDYPFKSRERLSLDEFQQRAISKFRDNPDLKFYKEAVMPLLGEANYRLATPVYMQQACLNCHNTHPASIKRDWKINDIRGIQEVSLSTSSIDFFKFRYLLTYFILITVLAAVSIFIFRRSALRLQIINAELESSRVAEQGITEQLKEKVNQLNLLGAVADRSTFGVTIADCKQPDYPIIYANDAFYKMTGLSKERVLGVNCRFLSGPLTSQESRNEIRNAIEKGLPHTVELINYRADESTFWNRLTLFPVGGELGNPQYYVGYQMDVTAIHEAEMERTAMLTEIQEGQKFESLGILVAGVSHEINNPLGIALTATSHITQSANALKKNLESKGLLSKEVKEFLEDEFEAFDLVQINLKRAVDLVKNFKEVATDRAHKSYRLIDLGDYLKTLAGSFIPLMRRARCKLNIETKDKIETILDTGSFGQLITNLVVNSTIHAFHGVNSPEIKITTKLSGSNVIIEITDNGNGISPAALANLFTPFFTTKRNHGGTGLGLFISKRIAVDELHGDLIGENNFAGGATFRINFPIQKNSDELNE